MMFALAPIYQYVLSMVGTASSFLGSNDEYILRPPPPPEPITIATLPLPPVVNLTSGACTAGINPRGTGCTTPFTGLQGGTFTSDGNHVVATIQFAGAPKTSDPASIFSGQQVILVKANGSLFPNGDGWKCITCGIAEENRRGLNLTDVKYDYPQAFRDGRRVLAGTYIIDCGDVDLTSSKCTAEKTTITSIHLDNTADGSGTGAALRELRLHPDNVHLGFNVFNFNGGRLGQTAYIGELHFNTSTGDSSAPRYDLIHVNQLHDPAAPAPLEVDGNELRINHSAITIGELRGFSGAGDEVLYIGYPAEACNIDVFAAHLVTGRVRRLTSNPGYVDPVQMSPDDQWMVIMDTRGTNRTMFMDGLRGIPPLTDLVTVTACSSVRNNGHRRFFQPWLLDRHGDRGDYFGQEINAASHGVAGSGAFDDPEWNGRADPWFSPDGTKIVYWQAQTVSPACGGESPLPCYESKEPGGRHERLLVAHLTDRKPREGKEVFDVPDQIPWAVPYTPSQPSPTRRGPEAGSYVLRGKFSGYADVELITAPDSKIINAVAATFHNYSDDGLRTISGYQNVSESVKHVTLDRTFWHSDLVQHGVETGRQWTSEEGFQLEIDVLQNVLRTNGTLTTGIGGEVYRQPIDGT